MTATVEYGVNQVAGRLHDSLRRYLEGQYHISDADTIEERRALLLEMGDGSHNAGTIGQRPYVETTPTYQMGAPYADLELPSPVGETLAELADWSPGIGVFPRPYTHQAEALRAFFNEETDLIVATGTGSGKTETFLLPILGQLLREAQERPNSWQLNGCRALLLYPMNALVSDQVSRLRRLLGDERLAGLFHDRYGRHPLFGMYTSRTPYPGVRKGSKDNRHLKDVLNYYLRLDAAEDKDPEKRAAQQRLAQELRKAGRWPAKDLDGFFAANQHLWKNRLLTQPDDRELLTRHEIQKRCPDVLVTNYSMLEYMLLRPIERNLFRQTREWLDSDKRNQLILVLDEAHMYRGAGGAEVGLLIRRLQARLNLPRERMRCILTSASLGSGIEAEKAVKTFAVGLTGHPIGKPMPFQLIRGQVEQRPSPRAGTKAEAAVLAGFDLAAFFDRAANLPGAMQAVAEIAKSLNWKPLPAVPQPGSNGAAYDTEAEFRRYLFEILDGFGPVNLLITTSSGHANEFAELAQNLFPDTDSETAQAATTTLLALGTYARKGDRPLLPTRVHLFFRGLPSLYACINPRCTHRRHRPGEEALLGRLYTEPVTHCGCGARVYELYTHRDCGAAFLRVFGRGPHADFYWHEKGGSIQHLEAPLLETYLLVGEPYSGDPKKAPKNIEPIWMDMATGRVETTPPSDETGYCRFYRPTPPAEDGAKKAHKATPLSTKKPNEPLNFTQCPACLKRSVGKIMDLATKGEQPFATLVREQLTQQPANKEVSAQFPNGGRKVLLFSDGRQKAARLARDLPREVEFDSFRQSMVLAAKRLNDLNKEARLDERLYIAFLSVCHDFHLHFFDRIANSLRQHNDNLRRFSKDYDADLETGLEAWHDREWSVTLPLGYKQNLLRQLCDPYYSLYSACAAVAQPAKTALKKMQKDVPDLPEEFRHEHLETVAIMWVQDLLERTAFDKSISEDSRRNVSEYFKPLKKGEKFTDFEKLLREQGKLTEAHLDILREALWEMTAEDDEGNAFIEPEQIKLELAYDATWYQCQACGLTALRKLFGHCPSCGHPELEERPSDHAYMTSRKAYFREPLREAVEGGRLSHLTAEEHTAQLSQRDAGDVYATTEEFELRFQDVSLESDKPPVDVLSCTTTMEVGIDIGSLTAVGLRNVPPQRENYQQRAGRAGRRGSAISTVVTYAQGGAHDNFYYQKPASIISGMPREPKVKVDNRRLALRHVRSFLIQTFFHEQIDSLPPEVQKELEEDRTNIMSAFGSASDFLNGDGPTSLTLFCQWLDKNVIQPPAPLAKSIASWLPDEICKNGGNEAALLKEKSVFAAEVAKDFAEALNKLKAKPAASTNAASKDGRAGNEVAGSESEVEEDETQNPGLLLNTLFDKGLLPSYAFPTDLCAFHVFEWFGKGKARVKERPQQGKDKALSEYAPGRLLVVNKQTYRVGGIHIDGTNSATPVDGLFAESLPSYVFCSVCNYVRLHKPIKGREACPVCKNDLKSNDLLDPPGFSPERGRPVSDRDREQDISHATSAQFPTPVEADRFIWKHSKEANLRFAYETERQLVIVNKGPGEEGFSVCQSCGAAMPTIADMKESHQRPFLLSSYLFKKGQTQKCNGPLHSESVYLGHTFQTDLLLLRIPLHIPLQYAPDQKPHDPWLQDALRTAAEALTLAACRRLDIDPGELSAGYRLMPPADEEDAEAQGVADIYLFDTAAGGAGYAAEAGEMLSDVLKDALALLNGCPEGCERSCTKCLRHYGNRYYHERFDRTLGAQLLTYAVRGEHPAVLSVKDQARLLQPLHRYLELEGYGSTLNGVVDSVSVPLLIPAGGKAGKKRPIAIGLYPSLLDPNELDHPLHALDSTDSATIVPINDYIITRDLPSAYSRLVEEAGL